MGNENNAGDAESLPPCIDMVPYCVFSSGWMAGALYTARTVLTKTKPTAWDL